MGRYMCHWHKGVLSLYCVSAMGDFCIPSHFPAISTLWHKGFGDSGLYGLSAADNGALYFAATTVVGSSMSLVNTGQDVTPTPTISMSAPSSDIYALNASDGSL